jgi:glycosyltransferase involved in cell wall biosynthesis
MSRAPTQPELYTQRLDIHASQYIPLPWLPSVAGGFHKFPACRAAIAAVEKRSDVVVVQLPFAASLALLGAHKPRVYHVCHDVLGAVHSSTYYSGLRGTAARALATGIDGLQRALLWGRHTRTVVNGRELWDHYGRPPGRAVVSATISSREILSASRKRSSDRFRVLFVGYLRQEKGIDTLVDAFELLLRHVPNAELCLVCATDTVDNAVTRSVRRRLESWRASGAVQFLGARAFGAELFECYADADALAVPSRAEGTPRVIVEARAMGCPVVATRVGGIPTSIRDGVDGLLVPPGDPSSLAAALLRVAQEPALRARLVSEGLSRAKDETVESFAGQIGDEATSLLRAIQEEG